RAAHRRRHGRGLRRQVQGPPDAAQARRGRAPGPEVRRRLLREGVAARAAVDPRRPAGPCLVAAASRPGAADPERTPQRQPYGRRPPRGGRLRGWPTGIRTPTDRTKTGCPAVRRWANVVAV